MKTLLKRIHLVPLCLLASLAYGSDDHSNKCISHYEIAEPHFRDGTPDTSSGNYYWKQSHWTFTLTTDASGPCCGIGCAAPLVSDMTTEFTFTNTKTRTRSSKPSFQLATLFSYLFGSKWDFERGESDTETETTHITYKHPHPACIEVYRVFKVEMSSHEVERRFMGAENVTRDQTDVTWGSKEVVLQPLDTYDVCTDTRVKISCPKSDPDQLHVL